ncbi:hypothetical protein PG993_007824 [Apiospora rasikravindrae]|uniref:Serine/arginine repetitive matrix protein 1 n=1 Tax=Apiospora rasikravindrae TaxID=990691 RepID=A0ABR1SYL7_9PEZI
MNVAAANACLPNTDLVAVFRYDDGEVTRYGAGESYRPFNDRADRERPERPERPDRRPRSPPRPVRSPPPRERARTPPALDNDRYIPDRDRDRTPRRRSRSPGRFRRDRSREREADRPAAGGDSWRRPRERTRSPARRPSPPPQRRSPLRRNSPPPRRFSPRRDIRDDRDRPRSPRRVYDSARSQHPDPYFQRPPASFPANIRSHPNSPQPRVPYHNSPPSASAPRFTQVREASVGVVAGENPNAIPLPSRRIHPSASSEDVGGESVNPNNLPLANNRLGPRRDPQYGSLGRPQNSPDKRHAHQSSNFGNDFVPANAGRNTVSNMAYRGRSRSPLDRDRGRDFRDLRDRERRSPGRRPSPPGSRTNNFRRRSPSMDRRDDRFGPPSRRQSPPRESAVSSAIQSRDISRRTSPHPISARSDDRSRPQSPLPSRPLSRSSHHAPGRDRSPVRGPPAVDSTTTPARSPPRGPAGYRAPPTGPRDNGRDMRDSRDSREQRRESVSASQSRPAPVPAGPSGRHDMPSPSNPPSGPRGFATSRGGGFGRGGGRGSNWGTTIQSRNIPPANGPASATAASNNIPTGPRASQTSLSVPSTPVSQPKPFNPPKGPSADLSTKRLSFAEQLVASLPPIIPGGKVDPSQLPLHTGVLPELQTHFNQLKEEEEKIRIDSYAKQEKLRKSLAHWDKLEREAKVMELRSTLSEQSLAKVSGDGVGGAAF